ncbi:17381_t:CDS:10 [Entrophospora sp. SA101]|nr:17381_t:CDS:10 [Entrophospora sp. SA101]
MHVQIPSPPLPPVDLHNDTFNLFPTHNMLPRRFKPIETCDNCKQRKNWNGFYPHMEPSLNQSLSEEALQFTSQLVASIQGDSQYIPIIDSNNSDNNGFSNIDQLEELANQFNNNLKIYESTRYVGTGSLLMLNETGEEQIIPQKQDDLSAVDQSLKYLPDPKTAESLINVYFQRKVVADCFKDLSTPQQFLLLNSIFFAAAPFHPDPKLRDGRMHYEKKALALLQNYCLQTPHVLTVVSLFILGLQSRKMGSAWIFYGMATKMSFELGLHRKIKNDQVQNTEVKELRDMAFWGCFIGEVWLSATYGRPSAIDEATCDVDLLPIPSDPEPDEETRSHIAWILHINLLRIFAQIRKYLYGRTKIAGSRREENQFKFLDAALGRWFYTLPNWLKFEEMAHDVEGSFLGSIGGEMHTLFWTVLILLHSRNLTMFTSNAPKNMPINNIDEESRISSQTICFHAATILLHWLDVLMNSVPDFFEQSCSALFSITPAIRVLSWTEAQKSNEKAAGMVQRLKEIKVQVREIARRRFSGGEGRLDGEATLKNLLVKAKEEESKNIEQLKSDEYDSHATTNNNNRGRKFNRRKNNIGFNDNINNNSNIDFNINHIHNNEGTLNTFDSWNNDELRKYVRVKCHVINPASSLTSTSTLRKLGFNEEQIPALVTIQKSGPHTNEKVVIGEMVRNIANGEDIALEITYSAKKKKTFLRSPVFHDSEPQMK